MIRFSLRAFHLLLAIAGCIFVSCSSRESSTSDGDSPTTASETDTTSIVDQRFYRIEAYQQTSPVDNQDVEVIESDCALLISPTEEQIAAMIKEYGEEDFSTIADDNAWYHSSASMLLDSIGVRIIVPSVRYVRLVGSEQSVTLDLRRRGALPWNLIFFNTRKSPEIVSTVDLSAKSIRQYFELKPLPDYAQEKFKNFSATYSLGDGLPQQFLEADFSGDKKVDVAVWVKQKDNGKKGILFFVDGVADPIVVGAGNELGHAGDDFKWAGIWEVVDAKLTEETTFSEEGDVNGSKPVTLEHPAISLREVEGSGGLIYFDGKTFTWIHQGD
jgi:hypothetical protein